MAGPVVCRRDRSSLHNVILKVHNDIGLHADNHVHRPGNCGILPQSHLYRSAQRGLFTRNKQIVGECSQYRSVYDRVSACLHNGRGNQLCPIGIGRQRELCHAIIYSVHLHVLVQTFRCDRHFVFHVSAARDHGAEFIVCRNQCPLEVPILIPHLAPVPRRLEGHIARLAEIERDAVVRKAERIWPVQFNLRRSGNCTVYRQGCRDRALSAFVRGKNARLCVDGAKRRALCQRPRSSRRDIHRETTAVHAARLKCDRAARRIYFVVRHQNRMVKFAGRLRAGKHHQRVGHAPLIAVGWAASERQTRAFAVGVDL